MYVCYVSFGHFWVSSEGEKRFLRLKAISCTIPLIEAHFLQIITQPILISKLI